MTGTRKAKTRNVILFLVRGAKVIIGRGRNDRSSNNNETKSTCTAINNAGRSSDG